MRILFLLLGFLLTALDVKALNAEGLSETGYQVDLQKTQMALMKEEVGESRGDLKLGAKASLGLESNAYEWGTRDHQATSTASGEMSLGINAYSILGRLAASKVLEETEEWKWAEDFQTTLSRKGWKLSRNFTLSPAISFILPVTEYSRKYSLLNAGYGARVTGKWDAKQFVRGLALSLSMRGSAYDYEIPVAFDGRSNEAWRANTRLVIDWEFVSSLELSLLFGRTWAWTENGTGLDKFEMQQSLSWSPWETTSISIGHSRGGDVLRGDGNSNTALYDSRDSSFSLDLTLSI